MQRFGQAAPVGLGAEQPVHDDDRRLVAPGAGHRLVQRVRHGHGHRAGTVRRAAELGEEQRGGLAAAPQQRRVGLDHVCNRGDARHSVRPGGGCGVHRTEVTTDASGARTSGGCCCGGGGRVACEDDGVWMATAPRFERE